MFSETDPDSFVMIWVGTGFYIAQKESDKQAKYRAKELEDQIFNLLMHG